MGPRPLRRRNGRASGSHWCPTAGFAPLGVRSLPAPAVIPQSYPVLLEAAQERSALLIGWIEGDIQRAGDSFLHSHLFDTPLNSDVPSQAEIPSFFFFFLDECGWPLVFPNVFELLENIFQKCWGKLGK